MSGLLIPGQDEQAKKKKFLEEITAACHRNDVEFIAYTALFKKDIPSGGRGKVVFTRGHHVTFRPSKGLFDAAWMAMRNYCSKIIVGM